MTTSYYITKGTAIYTSTFETTEAAVEAFVAKFGAIIPLRDGVFKFRGEVYEVASAKAPAGVNIKDWRAEQQAASRRETAAPRGTWRKSLWHENARQYGVDFANEEDADIEDARRYR